MSVSHAPRVGGGGAASTYKFMLIHGMGAAVEWIHIKVKVKVKVHDYGYDKTILDMIKTLPNAASSLETRYIDISISQSYHDIPIITRYLNHATISQSYHDISIIPRDLNLTTTSPSYHRISITLRYVSHTTISQSYHDIFIIPRYLNHTMISQSYHRISIIPRGIRDGPIGYPVAFDFAGWSEPKAGLSITILRQGRTV